MADFTVGFRSKQTGTATGDTAMQASTFFNDRVAARVRAASLWVVLFVLSVLVMQAVAEGPVHLLNQRSFSIDGWGAYRWARKVPLMIHLSGATVALVIGIVQFIPSIRRKHKNIHKWLGRIFMIASLVAGIFAVVLSSRMTTDGKWSSFILSVLWTASTIMSWAAIRRGNVAAHKDFVVRSYIFMLSFAYFGLFGRMVDASLGSSIATARLNNAWLYWLLPWIAVELWVGWRGALNSVPRIATRRDSSKFRLKDPGATNSDNSARCHPPASPSR